MKQAVITYMNFIIDMNSFACMSVILIQVVSALARSDFISAYDQSWYYQGKSDKVLHHILSALI